MGTPEFAVASLDELVSNHYNVVGVITVPDKPAGRGLQVQQSDVKKYALEKGLKILQPEKLKDESFLSELKSLQADLQIIVAFRMLPEAVWTMPRLGTFNLHGSLLPQYRGAAPINRAVMNGDKETGVTTFFLQHEIDTGNIIYREIIPIGEDDTAGDIHDRLMLTGAKLVRKTVDSVASGNCPKIPQSELVQPGEKLKSAPKIFREDCRIDWTKTSGEIHNQVRGLSPYPAAWTELLETNGKKTAVKIFRTEKPAKACTASPGTILPGLKVATGDGYVIIKELQLAGKKRMPADEFLRGFRIPDDAVFS
ncbi:MAG: methionyl-tRNA formyltransferase [Bacteroidetes bacterium]|nr:MAG: methionyl-tRNA formyltransferase [Bacteroidota bacterium]